MRGFVEHVRLALLLSVRHRLALLYSYLLPLVFLVSFLVLYRAEDPLLVRHMGELLTVGLLSTACFGLPTSLVSERERGVWRRIRLTPAATGTLVTGTVAARYVIVMSALAIQLLLSMAIGRWTPAHPLQLWIAASIAAAALLALGLMIAALADTVPAAQALGQSVFLPMLIIGGVAVRLDMLPDWLLPVAAFLPGRYAVETIQSCIDGDGLSGMGFHVAALATMGVAGGLAGTKLFRWDSGSRFVTLPQRSWAALALASWVVVGALAVARGELTDRRPRTTPLVDASVRPARATSPTPAPILPAAPGGRSSGAPSGATGSAAAGAESPAQVTGTDRDAGGSLPAAAAPEGRRGDVPPAAARSGGEPWRALTQFDFAALPLADMPPDDGNISPIAAADDAPAGSTADEMQRVVDALPRWPPGHVADPVQRVRNHLLILAVADFAQSPLERFLPAAVLAHLLTQFEPQELAQLLCWIALHPDEGDLSALTDPLLVRLGAATLDRDELRLRTYYYGAKLTRRVVGW